MNYSLLLDPPNKENYVDTLSLPVILSQSHGRLRYAFIDNSAVFRYPCIYKNHRNAYIQICIQNAH